MLAPVFTVLGDFGGGAIAHIGPVGIQIPHGMQFCLLGVTGGCQQRDDQHILFLCPGGLRYGNLNIRVVQCSLQQPGLQMLHNGIVLFGFIFLIGGKTVIVVPFQSLVNKGDGRSAKQQGILR